MRRNPAAQVHANGRNLGCVIPFTNPNASQFRDSLRKDSKLFQSINENLLNRPDERAYITLPEPKVHNRIRHNLAWPVVGHVAATVALVQFDALLFQKRGRGEKVFFVPVAPDRHDMMVFHLRS